jgi:hypothetical protein
MKRSNRFAIVSFLLLAGGWLALGIWTAQFGPLAEGQVVAKEERVLFSSSDRWTHELNVRYRYRPAGARTPEEGRHRVDEALFDRLSPGMSIEVRYHPWSFVRRVAGFGSLLAASSWWERNLPLESSYAVQHLDIAIILVAGLALWRAFVRGRRTVAMLAGVLGSAVVYGILVLGALVWPAWLLLWRRKREGKYLLGLVLSVLLGTIVLAMRFPWSAAASNASGVLEAEAVIVQAHKANTLWTNGRRRGDPLAQHFVLIDLEFTPQGGQRPVHAVDRVDDPGDRRYGKGELVRVEYPPQSPRQARIANASRDFIAHSFTHFLLVWTLGGGIVVLLLAWAGIRIKQAVSRRLSLSPAASSDLLGRRPFIRIQPKGDRS